MNNEYHKKSIVDGHKYSKRVAEYVTILLAAIPEGIALLPFLSAHPNGELVSGDIIIRGYNLTEFSALGVMPLIAPLLVVLLIQISRKTDLRELSLILLLCANMICCTHAVNASKAWLCEVCDSRLQHPLSPAVRAWQLSSLKAAELLPRMEKSAESPTAAEQKSGKKS